MFQRSTPPNSRLSPHPLLQISAARSGQLCVLDGIDRVDTHVLVALQVCVPRVVMRCFNNVLFSIRV